MVWAKWFGVAAGNWRLPKLGSSALAKCSRCLSRAAVVGCASSAASLPACLPHRVASSYARCYHCHCHCCCHCWCCCCLPNPLSPAWGILLQRLFNMCLKRAGGAAAATVAGIALPAQLTSALATSCSCSSSSCLSSCLLPPACCTFPFCTFPFFN